MISGNLEDVRRFEFAELNILEFVHHAGKTEHRVRDGLIVAGDYLDQFL